MREIKEQAFYFLRFLIGLSIMKQIFLGCAQVAIQGERVLRFLDLTEKKVVYQIIGFEDPIITVVDYRASGLFAIQSLLDTGDLKSFAPRFNTASMVEIPTCVGNTYRFIG